MGNPVRNANNRKIIIDNDSSFPKEAVPSVAAGTTASPHLRPALRCGCCFVAAHTLSAVNRVN